jgi:uncharacterized protein DUF2793
MTDTSARFSLPFLLPGQAQKEVFHNEALAIVDAALHPSVEEGPLAAPPAGPDEGKCWIAAAAATGEWAGHDHDVACWTGGGWRFVAPIAGMLAWNADTGCWLHWTGAAWSDGSLPAARFTIGGQQVVGPRLPDVPNPSGGTTIDAEARAALGAIIATLKSHGLID